MNLLSSIKILFLSTLISFSAFGSDDNIIVKTLTLKASQSDVWKALTTAEELGKWWGPGVRLEPKKGGQFYEPWGNDQLATGVVLNIKTGDSIRFTWQEKTWQPEQKTVCEFMLKHAGGVTTLTVRHSGWESFTVAEARRRVIEGFKIGWDRVVLSKLSKYFEDRN